MKLGLTILLILKISLGYTQFVVGSGGMHLKSGAVLTIDGLSLTPSSDLSIISNALERSSEPIPGKPNGSIRRVYSFLSPIQFSGNAGIGYLTSELNGSTENTLNIVYSLGTSTTFTLTTGSSRNLTTHQVSNALNVENMSRITASGEGNSLPVKLVEFSARAEEQSARLNWSTSYENNSGHFEIEHRTDARAWEEIGRQVASGESDMEKSYSFSHGNAADGQNYYRLKMVDLDGTFAYSAVRNVTFDRPASLEIFPNPTSDKLFLRDLKKTAGEIRIYNVRGTLVYKSSNIPADGIDMKAFPAGSYVLKANRENGRADVVRFVLQ